MNFSEALDTIKRGGCASRAGWNGKGMFVFLVKSSTFQVNRPPLDGIFPHGTEVRYGDHIDLRCADGTISTWAPSMTDLFAEDWAAVAPTVKPSPIANVKTKTGDHK